MIKAIILSKIDGNNEHIFKDVWIFRAAINNLVQQINHRIACTWHLCLKETVEN